MKVQNYRSLDQSGALDLPFHLNHKKQANQDRLTSEVNGKIENELLMVGLGRYSTGAVVVERRT